jgi:hypothetical protein
LAAIFDLSTFVDRLPIYGRRRSPFSSPIEQGTKQVVLPATQAGFLLFSCCFLAAIFNRSPFPSFMGQGTKQVVLPATQAGFLPKGKN